MTDQELADLTGLAELIRCAAHDGHDPGQCACGGLPDGAHAGSCDGRTRAQKTERLCALAAQASTALTGYQAHLDADHARLADLTGLAGDVLSRFSGASGDGQRARVGQVQMAKWRAVLDA